MTGTMFVPPRQTKTTTMEYIIGECHPSNTFDQADKNLGNDEENGSEPTNSSDSSGSSNFDIDNSYGQPGILESSTILTSQPVLNNSKDELKVLFGPVVGEV